MRSPRRLLGGRPGGVDEEEAEPRVAEAAESPCVDATRMRTSRRRGIEGCDAAEGEEGTEANAETAREGLSASRAPGEGRCARCVIEPASVRSVAEAGVPTSPSPGGVERRGADGGAGAVSSEDSHVRWFLRSATAVMPCAAFEALIF